MSLKNKIKQNKVTIGSWITLPDESVAEIMAGSGFDWLVVDMEHSPIELLQAQRLIRVIELCGVVPLVRVGENNPNIIKRVMDAGAHGVVVPMVNTKEDAIRAVKAAKYPPTGTRGVGLTRAQKYGFGFEEYREWAEENTVVIVQIEHVDAVNNIEDILKVDGVDGFIIGPYDLSGSLGKPGKFEDPEVKEYLEKVKKVLKETDKVGGFHVIPPSCEKVEEKIKEGYKFVAFSLDTLFLGSKCKETMDRIKGVKI